MGYETQYDEAGNPIGTTWVADETPSYVGAEGTLGDQAGDFPFRDGKSGLVNTREGDLWANTPYDPSQGTGQGLSFTYNPDTGARNYYKATGLPSGYYDPKALTVSTGSGVDKLKNLANQAKKALGAKTETLGGIGDLLMSLLALKYATSGGMKPQIAGSKEKINMALKAVQPTNVPAQRAYGAGAVGQPYKATTYAAEGGLMGLAAGGLRDGAFIIPADVVSHLGNGSSEAGLKLLAKKFGATPIKGAGDGMSDSIDTTIEGKRPAKVANEEAIVSPEKVTELGGGNPKKGAKVLYAMMDRVRKARTGTKRQGKQIKPEKFMPGGIARYAGGGAVAFNTGGPSTTTPSIGSSTTSNLSEWAGPYVTDMLSKANALANQPYQAYTGQLTAGTSPLQQQAFTGYGTMQVPSSIGQAAQTAGEVAGKAGALGYAPSQFANQFQAPGAYQAGQFANQFDRPKDYQTGQFYTGLGPVGSVQSYMSPYLQGVTDIEAREARRQADIDRAAAASRLAQAGAYGGSRQAIMEAEGLRNLQTRIGDITAKGLQSAYDRALQQRLAESQASMEAQKAGEASRQFGAQQGMTGAQLAAQYGLAGQELGERSRQFGAGQALTAAQLGAQYGLSAQQEAERSRQFGAGYGLDALRQQLAGAQLQGTMGAQQADLGLRNLSAQLAAGQQQSAIEQQALDAQRAQFEEARAYPYKQLQFQQSMLNQLPINTYSSTPNTSQYDDLRAMLAAILGPLGPSNT